MAPKGKLADDMSVVAPASKNELKRWKRFS